MGNLSLQDIVQLIIALSIVIGFVVGFITWLRSIFVYVAKIYRLCNVIQEQFSTNGGTSLRDAVNRIERNQSEFKLLQFAIYTYWDVVSPSPMVISDTNGYYVWANKAYLSMVGKTLDEVIGTNWESYVHQDDRNDTIREWYESCIDGRPFEGSFRVIHSNGTVIKIKCKTRANKEYGYVGFISQHD